MFYPEGVVSVLKYVVLKQMSFDWWLEVVIDIAYSYQEQRDPRY